MRKSQRISTPSSLTSDAISCEPEDQEPVECKVEEQAYHVPDSPQWAPSGANTTVTSIDNVFPGTSLYQEIHHTPSHSPVTSPTLSSYSRESAGDRWPIPLDNLRISSSARQDVSWSPSPSPTNPHGVSRRRDGASPQSGSWSPIQSQSARWRPDSYDSSMATSGSHLERSSRVRSSTMYQESGVGPHRSHRETENVSGFHNRLTVDPGSRESGHQRLPWLSRETSSVDKQIRNSHPDSPFNPSCTATQLTSHHGYHRPTHSYGAWPSNVNSLAHTSQLHPVSSPSALHSYAASYTSSPEDLSTIEDFGDT